MGKTIIMNNRVNIKRNENKNRSIISLVKELRSINYIKSSEEANLFLKNYSDNEIIKMNLDSILNKLEKAGYTVRITENFFDGYPWIRGGIKKAEGELFLGVEILISYDEESFFVLDIDKQTGTKKRFNNEDSIVAFIIHKYPIEQYI